MAEDIKDVLIDGCRVHLAFRNAEGRWAVQGTVHCGATEAESAASFLTDSKATREEAEQEALHRAIGLLGRNVDRNTSRVRNWS